MEDRFGADRGDDGRIYALQNSGLNAPMIKIKYLLFTCDNACQTATMITVRCDVNTIHDATPHAFSLFLHSWK